MGNSCVAAGIGSLRHAARFWWLALLVFGLLRIGAAARACETTIREQAFKEKRDTHRLCLAAESREGQAKAQYERLRAWLAGPAANFNASLEWVDALDPKTQWTQMGIPSAPPSLPVSILVGRDRTEGTRHFVIEHWAPAPTDAELALLLDSPARHALRQELCSHWAVLLYSAGASGTDAPGAAAIEAVAREWSSAHPPGVGIVRFDPGDPQERLLAAFTGAGAQGPEWIGAAFGRGKLMAPPLVGEQITEDALDEHLQQVLEACTCLRPPERMGVDIPMVWEPELDGKIVVLEAAASGEKAQGLREAGASGPADAERSYWLAALAGLAGAAIAVFAASAWLARREKRRAAP